MSRPDNVTERRPLLTVREVASLFAVNPKTVVRWSNDGKIRPVKTLGGHRRFYEDEILSLLNPPRDN